MKKLEPKVIIPIAVISVLAIFLLLRKKQSQVETEAEAGGYSQFLYVPPIGVGGLSGTALEQASQLVTSLTSEEESNKTESTETVKTTDFHTPDSEIDSIPQKYTEKWGGWGRNWGFNPKDKDALKNFIHSVETFYGRNILDISPKEITEYIDKYTYKPNIPTQQKPNIQIYHKPNIPTQQKPNRPSAEELSQQAARLADQAARLAQQEFMRRQEQNLNVSSGISDSKPRTVVHEATKPTIPESKPNVSISTTAIANIPPERQAVVSHQESSQKTSIPQERKEYIRAINNAVNQSANVVSSIASIPPERQAIVNYQQSQQKQEAKKEAQLPPERQAAVSYQQAVKEAQERTSKKAEQSITQERKAVVEHNETKKSPESYIPPERQAVMGYSHVEGTDTTKILRSKNIAI